MFKPGFVFIKYTNNSNIFKSIKFSEKKKNFFFPIKNFPMRNVSSSNFGGNGGRNGKNTKNFGWDNYYNYFYFVIFLLLILLTSFNFYNSFRNTHWINLPLKKKSENNLMCNEIILRNCELIPTDYICFNFKLLLNKKINQNSLVSVNTLLNRWYKEKNYLFSFIQKTRIIFIENFYQMLFVGIEPKIKNILIEKKGETSIDMILNLIELKSGNNFKWCSQKWEDIVHSSLFVESNFSVKMIKTTNETIFLDLNINIKEANNLLIQPGLSLEKNCFSGIFLTENKNLFRKGISCKSSLIKNPLNEIFLSIELQKIFYSMSKIFFMFQNTIRKKRQKIYKIGKIYGKKYKEKLEIFYIGKKKNETLMSTLNAFFSNLYLIYFKVIKLKKKSKFLISYYIKIYKKCSSQKNIHFHFKANFLSKIFPFSNNCLCPKFIFKNILKTSNVFFLENQLLFSSSKKAITNLNQNKNSSLMNFYFDFSSLMQKYISFFIFIDLSKFMNKKNIFMKSFGIGIKLNKILNIYSIITPNSEIKLIMNTL